jgi:hypothetical protein
MFDQIRLESQAQRKTLKEDIEGVWISGI